MGLDGFVNLQDPAVRGQIIGIGRRYFDPSKLQILAVCHGVVESVAREQLIMRVDGKLPRHTTVALNDT